VAERCGDEERGVRLVWWLNLAAYTALVPLLWYGWMLAAIALFVILNILQNLFRPMHISRFDSHSEEYMGATILSVESQAKNVAAMMLAPVLGVLVDRAVAGGHGSGFWPVAAAGAVLAAVTIAADRRPTSR
jgi:hypothetical protein